MFTSTCLRKLVKGIIICICLQSALLAEHFKVFDIYRKKFLVGEMIWNFADFNTAQSEKDYIDYEF